MIPDGETETLYKVLGNSHRQDTWQKKKKFVKKIPLQKLQDKRYLTKSFNDDMNTDSFPHPQKNEVGG